MGSRIANARGFLGNSVKVQTEEGNPSAPSRLERRLGRRFPLKMDVQYQLFLTGERRILSEGADHTVDISNTGVLLNTPKACPLGAAAVLTIKWPVASEDAIPMHLHVAGSVVRSDPRGTAIRILRHDFTRSTRQLFAEMAKSTRTERQV